MEDVYVEELYEEQENCIYYIKALAEQEKEEIEIMHQMHIKEQEDRNNKIHQIARRHPERHQRGPAVQYPAAGYPLYRGS